MSARTDPRGGYQAIGIPTATSPGQLLSVLEFLRFRFAGQPESISSVGRELKSGSEPIRRCTACVPYPAYLITCEPDLVGPPGPEPGANELWLL
jgi:hypothetical protein